MNIKSPGRRKATLALIHIPDKGRRLFYALPRSTKILSVRHSETIRKSDAAHQGPNSGRRGSGRNGKAQRASAATCSFHMRKDGNMSRSVILEMLSGPGIMTEVDKEVGSAQWHHNDLCRPR